MMRWLAKYKPKTIKRQLILGVALVHAILMSIFVYDLVTREQEFLLSHTEEQASLLAKTISTSALPWVLSNNLSGLEEIVRAQDQFPNLDFVMITSPEGEVLAHTNQNNVGKFLADKASISMLESPAEKMLLVRSLNNVDIAQKILLDGRELGWIRVSLSTETVTQNLQQILLEGLAYTIAAILIGSMIAWLLSNSLTRRIRVLIDATKDVKPDRINNLFDEVEEDEVGELMTNFNFMERQLNEQFAKVQQMAYRDALTKLYSRAYFDLAYNNCKKGFLEEQKSCGLIIVDVDNFKQLNDSYGHDVGDQLLVEVASRIKKFIKDNDFAFRFGGDEFVLLMTNLNPQNADGVLKGLVQQLQILISKPCQLGNLIYTPQFSLGIYSITSENSMRDAFKKADIALYNAKRLGKGQMSFFLPAMEEEVEKRNYYEEGLKSAINNQELNWVIQPQVNMSTNQVVGGEVLLRWNYQGEFVRPDIFIPITEENQTIIPISNWLLEEVFKWIQLNELHHIKISINLSPIHFFDSGLLPNLKKLLDTYQISPYNIKFEVTEGVFLQRMEIALNVINKLKNIGFKISLDDFGTGFSSLSYLKNLPIDQLKIDKSFVDGLPDNEKPAAIAKTIIDLTQNLELSVIAEGVETIEQKDFLLQNDCIYCQGYLYSKPVAPKRFIELMENGF